MHTHHYACVIALTALLTAPAFAESNPATITIERRPLLTAPIENSKNVERVEVKEIAFTAGQMTGVHEHPCPVVGYVAAGTIQFQVEGQALQTLKAGDAFFEPANKKILHFDAADGPAKFVAFYLLGKDDHELIRMLN